MHQRRAKPFFILLTTFLGFGAAAREASAQSTDLSVDVYPQETPRIAGRNGAYTINVWNNGSELAQDLVLTNQLPPTATPDGYEVCLSDPDAGSLCTFYNPPAVDGAYTIPLGDLVAGDLAVVYVYVITPVEVGSITNTASITSSTFDPDLGNNQASATIEVVRGADLVVEVKAERRGHQKVIVTVTLTNRGPDTADTARVAANFGGVFEILKFKSPTRGATCSTDSWNVGCGVSTLAPGKKLVLRAKVKVACDLFVGGVGFAIYTPDIDAGNNVVYVDVPGGKHCTPGDAVAPDDDDDRDDDF